MMHGSNGGGLSAFEGLVHTTARMFAAQVRREEDDLAQELRVRVWRAMVSYDPAKSRLSLERYVFQAVTNKIKDYKRDAAREARRLQDNGITLLHIEDMRLGAVDHSGQGRGSQQESFDNLFHYVERDEVYRSIDEGKFVVPATVTHSEARVLLLMLMDVTRAEIAMRLGVPRATVDEHVRALREKLADWRPTPPQSRIVDLAIAA